MGLHFLRVFNAVELSGLARLTAGALVAGLWQGIVLCAAAGLLLNLIPKTTATVRFVLWATVFGVSVGLPFFNLPGVFTGRVGSMAASHVMLNLNWSYVLAGLWLLAATYRMGQLTMQGFGLRMLWLTAAPVADEDLAGLDVTLSVAGRPVQLCTSEEVDRPSVIGFLAPKILIPSWLFDQLSVVELKHIVLHELEHLRRRDDWINLLQKIGLVLLPVNPALFWMDRKLSTERELACDDGVLERTNTPRAYAKSLASIAERRMDVQRHGRFGQLALAATGPRRRSELGKRIESILGSRTPVSRAFTSGLAAVFVAGVAGGGFALAHAPKLISFGPDPSALRAMSSPATTIQPAPRLAPTLVASGGMRSAAARRSPAATFQDVSFHVPTKVRAVSAKASIRKPAAIAKAVVGSQDLLVAPRQQRLVVLTSWEDSPVSRVVVQTPEGRFFLAPYAAVPTQAGWLFVQL